jgi:predicted acylesterase/phospholipase RssA
MSDAQSKLPAISSFDTLIFAGGGNRCWWQAGVIHEWLSSGQLHATRYIGTSAGAGIAYTAATGRLEDALRACKSAYASNPRLLESTLPLKFAHERIYPQWVRSFVDEKSLAQLDQANRPEVWVGLARLPGWLPQKMALTIGALAYIADKYFGQHIHPKILPRLGFRMQILPVNKASGVFGTQALMRAAAAAPPFMAAQQFAGSMAVDGGFADNAPRIALKHPNEKQLVLLTRHYPDLALVFELEGRWYCQPSSKIAVSTWDCTPRADVDTTFEHGRSDALSLTKMMIG